VPLCLDQPNSAAMRAFLVEDRSMAVWWGSPGECWSAFARLRREGHVVLRVLGPRRGPHRNLYRVTAAGRRELRRWLLETPPPPRGRDDGLARIAFLDFLPAPERRQALRGYEKVIGDEIARLRSATRPEGFRSEARDGAVEKLEGARRWARSLASRPSLIAPSEAGGRGASGRKT